MEIKTETVTKEIQKVGVWFEMTELREVVESLYETNKDGNLAHQMNDIHRKFNDALNDMQKGITQEDIINNSDCSLGSCD
tara:strand:- start:38 stop:277 length:240 start_codon:yes stop_codon:yes gene_type:complete